MFANNSAGLSGGAIFAGLSVISQTTFCGNAPEHIAGLFSDGGGNIFLDECPEVCLGDVDGDGVVDDSDLCILLLSWGTCSGCAADVDDSGIVDFADLVLVLGYWGPC